MRLLNKVNNEWTRDTEAARQSSSRPCVGTQRVVVAVVSGEVSVLDHQFGNVSCLSEIAVFFPDLFERNTTLGAILLCQLLVQGFNFAICHCIFPYDHTESTTAPGYLGPYRIYIKQTTPCRGGSYVNKEKEYALVFRLFVPSNRHMSDSICTPGYVIWHPSSV